MAIIYIAGPMSGIEGHSRQEFNRVAYWLSEQGHSVLNPATLPGGLTQGQYMQVCLSMVMVADELVMLTGWEQDNLAYIAFLAAKKSGKTIRSANGDLLHEGERK